MMANGRRLQLAIGAGPAAAALRARAWPLLFFLLASCSESRGARASLVVYAAVDRETAEPVIAAYERASGVDLRVVFDSESAKTAALAARLELEQERPRADVWWSGESLFTCLLEAKGCFAPLELERGEEREPDLKGDAWIGFGGRLRVLVYRTDLWPAELPLPNSVHDLARPELHGRCVLAKPTVGTAATHAAWLAAQPQRRELLHALEANAAMFVASNSAVVRAVAKGQALLGLTDSDDALIACADEPRLRFAIPDQEAGGMGVMWSASSAAVVAGCAEPRRARAFVAWLASAEGESVLARTASRNLPFALEASSPLEFPAMRELHLARVDYARLSADWEGTRAFLVELFGR